MLEFIKNCPFLSASIVFLLASVVFVWLDAFKSRRTWEVGWKYWAGFVFLGLCAVSLYLGRNESSYPE